MEDNVEDNNKQKEVILLLTALIMAGGQGTRFWPLSRADRPKQFLKLTDNQLTMLQSTVQRLKGIVAEERVFIATNEEYRQAISEQLPVIPEDNIIIEPCKRDTAPAVGLSTLYIEEKYPGATMVILPADHLIEDEDRFSQLVEKAVMIAAKERNLITLGIKPTRPETGYGYIHCGKLYHTIDEDHVYKVESFTEKPDQVTAVKFFKDDSYLWNSGMFIWQTGTILHKIKEYMPELYDSLMVMKGALGTGQEKEIIKKEFDKIEGVSIDYGIMEKADDIYVLPADFGWDDLGSWPALERVKKVDENKNIILGKHYGIDTSNAIIYSPDKVVTTIGLEDIVIVNTKDAILICKKDRAQEVKEIREILLQNGLEEYL